MEEPLVALAASTYARSFASFEEATSTVVATLEARLAGSGVIVGRFDRLAEVYRVIAGTGGAPHGLGVGAEVPLADAFCAELAGHVATVVSADAPPGAQGIASFAGVALELSDGQHVGSLCAVSAEPDTYGDDDLALLVVFGRLLAYEIERQLQGEALERMAAELARSARTDGLTGLLNRAAFELELEREWRLTSRDWTDSHLVLVEIVGLQAVKAQFGHADADAAVVDATEVLRTTTRSTDILARTGEAELGAILVRTTGGCDVSDLRSRLSAELDRVLADRPYRVGLRLGHCSLLEALSCRQAMDTAEVRRDAQGRPAPGTATCSGT